MEYFVKNSYHLFKKLLEFANDTIWAWCFIFLKIISCWFNVLNRCWLFRLYILFLWVLVVCVIKKCSISPKFLNLWTELLIESVCIIQGFIKLYMQNILPIALAKYLWKTQSCNYPLKILFYESSMIGKFNIMFFL